MVLHNYIKVCWAQPLYQDPCLVVQKKKSLFYLLLVTLTTKVMCCHCITPRAFTVLMRNAGTHYMEIHPVDLTIFSTNIKLLFVNLTPFCYFPLFVCLLSLKIFSSSTIYSVCMCVCMFVCVCVLQANSHCRQAEVKVSLSSLYVHNKFEVPTCRSAMVAMTVSTSRSNAISPQSIVRFVLCLSSSCSSSCQHCRTSSLRCVTRSFP